MGFKCGLVGMPNVGKSSIFNLLTSQKIDAKNFPFCTIDPNIATVEVPDKKLDKLSDLNASKNKINAYIDVVLKGFPPTKRGCILNTLLNFSLDI